MINLLASVIVSTYALGTCPPNVSLAITDLFERSETLREQSFIMCLVLGSTAFVAILLAAWRRWWTLATATVFGVVLVGARALLVWKGFIYQPGRVRLLDVLLATLVAAIVGFAIARRTRSMQPEQRVGLSGGLLALPVAAFTLLQLIVPASPPDSEVAACDGAATAGAEFLAKTGVNGLNARSGPGTTYQPTRRFDAGCLVGADGYCVGESVKDQFVPSLFDVRWLRLRHTNEYVAAGLVFGLRPERELGDAPEADCPEANPDPAFDGAVAARAIDPDTVRLWARPDGSDVVGFGVAYLGAEGKLIDVHQLGISPKVRGADGVVRADLSLSGNRQFSPEAETLTVAVVACLAPIIPSHSPGQLFVVDLRTGAVSRRAWDLETRDRQVQAACRLDPTQDAEAYRNAATR